MKFLTYVGCATFFALAYTSCQPCAYAWHEKQLPHFELPDEKNAKHSLNEFDGKWLVVCFLPDFTENRIDMAYLAEAYTPFVRHNIDVICISYEPVKELNRIKKLLALPFMLLSDCDYTVSEQLINPYYDRATFIISPEGVVKKVIVTPHSEYHIAEILLFFIKNQVISCPKTNQVERLSKPLNTPEPKSFPSNLTSSPILPFCLPDDMAIAHDLIDTVGEKFVLSFLLEEVGQEHIKHLAYFSDIYNWLDGQEVEVLCVSKYTVDQLHTLRQRLQVPFILLSDYERTVYHKYNVSTGLDEGYVTLIVNKNGIIEKAIENINATEHLVQTILFFLGQPAKR